MAKLGPRHRRTQERGPKLSFAPPNGLGFRPISQPDPPHPTWRTKLVLSGTPPIRPPPPRKWHRLKFIIYDVWCGCKTCPGVHPNSEHWFQLVIAIFRFRLYSERAPGLRKFSKNLSFFLSYIILDVVSLWYWDFSATPTNRPPSKMTPMHF